jgi:predicted ATPase
VIGRTEELARLAELAATVSTGGAVAVAEDPHWLDSSTAAVIGFLARRLTAAPIMVVVTVLTEPEDPNLLRSLPGIRLELGPLSEAEAGEVLDRVAADLPPAARARILSEAGAIRRLCRRSRSRYANAGWPLA